MKFNECIFLRWEITTSLRTRFSLRVKATVWKLLCWLWWRRRCRWSSRKVVFSSAALPASSTYIVSRRLSSSRKTRHSWHTSWGLRHPTTRQAVNYVLYIYIDRISIWIYIHIPYKVFLYIGSTWAQWQFQGRRNTYYFYYSSFKFFTRSNARS